MREASKTLLMCVYTVTVQRSEYPVGEGYSNILHVTSSFSQWPWPSSLHVLRHTYTRCISSSASAASSGQRRQLPDRARGLATQHHHRGCNARVSLGVTCTCSGSGSASDTCCRASRTSSVSSSGASTPVCASVDRNAFQNICNNPQALVK